MADLIAASPVVVMLGSGPSYGTALYSAAKLVEAAGVFVLGQDLEEWWHVERFSYPVDMPVFVIAPPGRSHWRAQSVAATARGLGRRVITVTHTDDTEVTRHAHMVLPVHGEVREEFSPLLYHSLYQLRSSLRRRAFRPLSLPKRPARIAPVGKRVLRQPATGCGEGLDESLATLIDVTAVTYFDDRDDELGVPDFINEAVRTLANSESFLA